MDYRESWGLAKPSSSGSAGVGIVIVVGVVLAIIYLIAQNFGGKQSSPSGTNTVKTSQTSTEEIERAYRNGTKCIPADNAASYVGVNGCVEMTIKHYYSAEYGWLWLNSKGSSPDFSALIMNSRVMTAEDAYYLLGARIKVYGTIELYNNEPQIKVSNASNIIIIQTAEEIEYEEELERQAEEAERTYRAEQSWMDKYQDNSY